MLKLNNLLISITGLLILNSCGSAKDIPLEIPIVESEVYFVDGNTKSCRTMYESSSAGDTEDIQSHYFQVQNLKLIWSEATTKFNLSSIRMIISSPFLIPTTQTIILPSAEIAYLTGTASTPWNQRMDNSANVTFSCPLTFGGIEFSHDVPFTTEATIDFIGYKYKVDSNNEYYDEEPVTLTKRVTITNL